MAEHGQELVVHSERKCFTSTGRGPTKLKKLNKRNERRIKVTYNSRGQPIGDSKNALASYIGILVKHNIPITYHNWAKVPKTIKKDLWNSIQLKFEVDPKTEKEVIKALAKSWRNFKGQLTRFHITPNKNNPELLKNPPPKYKKMISQSVWEEFVRGRLSEDFQRTSKLQTERRAKCMYNHRTSKKGYVGLEEELKEKMGPSYKVDKTLLWLKARQNKDGEYADDATKEMAEKILELKSQAEDGTEENVEILRMALGQPDNLGRFRCEGLGVVPTKKNSKKNINELERRLDEERKKRIEAEQLLQHLQAQFNEFETDSINSTKSSKEFGFDPDESDFSSPSANASGNSNFVRPSADAIGNSDIVRPFANATGNSKFIRSIPDVSGNSDFIRPSVNASGNSEFIRPIATVSGNSDFIRPSANARGNSDFVRPSANATGNSEFIRTSPTVSGNSDFIRPFANASGNSDVVRPSGKASGNSKLLRPSGNASGNSKFIRPSASASGNSDLLKASANAPCSWGGSKTRSHNLKFKADELAKTDKQDSDPFKDNGYGKIQHQDSHPISITGKFEGDGQAKTQNQDSNPISNIAKGQKCKLAIGSKNKIVAEGLFFKNEGPDEIIHNIIYGENNLRVSITKVFSPYAILPIPVPNEMETVKDALGSFVVWPKKFVLFEDIEEEKYDDSSSEIPIKESEALLDLQGSFGSTSKFKGDDDKMKAPQLSQTYTRKGKRGRPIGSKTDVTAEVKDVENDRGRIAKTRRVSVPVSKKRKGRKRKVTDVVAAEGMDTEKENDGDDGYGRNGENTLIDNQNWESGTLINIETEKLGALVNSQSGENIDAQSGENSALVDAFALTVQTMDTIEIKIPLDKDIFGEENVECYIFKNNLLGFCALKALDATCIATYIRYLYDKHESSRGIVKFFNPASVSAASKLGISRLITKRLQNAKANQIYFIPYHIQAKSHWVLIVIDCSSMNIFWLDSSNGKPDEQTKFYINTGLNSVLIDGKRRLPTWNINTCPKQEGNVESGYYVMKFMSELMDDPSISVGTKMKKIAEKETYTIEEINDVRIEFMEFVIEHLGDV